MDKITKYRTETFGYSKVLSTSTTRSVLYGDPSITNDGTRSWYKFFSGFHRLLEPRVSEVFKTPLIKTNDFGRILDMKVFVTSFGNPLET